MEQSVPQRWYGDSAAAGLRPLAWVYGTVMSIRRRAYANGWLRAHRVGRPVLVVGNLTVGGTGKTPLVAWISQQLTARGLKVGIVSRGYGRSDDSVRVVEKDDDWRAVGDEPLLLKTRTNCLTVVAADRVAGARALVAQGVDAIVTDDGLQHLRLARDCEIAVVDGTRGFGNGHLLPAGPLREPPSRLDSVDLVVVNGRPEHASVSGNQHLLQMRLRLDQALPVTGAGQPLPLASFRGQRVHAVAGIGNPARFFRDLRERGLEVIEHPFPDHHAFAAADLAFPDGIPVLMTEKDAVKCRAFADPRHWCVPVTAEFDEAHARRLRDHVLRKLDLPSHARG